MDAADAERKIVSKAVFRDRTNDEKHKLLEEKDKKSTQRATKGYVNQLNAFLTLKHYPSADELKTEDLPDILYEYYAAVRPQKDEDYCVQTLKCIRAALNRFFKPKLGIDITKDTRFVRANEMFKAMTVQSKRNGKGVKKSTPTITQLDLERIAEYFCNDHVTLPNPKKLQQNIIFYIIYFFCRRGRENLYNMQVDTFKILVDSDGTEILIQDKDEIDKNHGPEDYTKTNNAKVYATNGKYYFYQQNNK